MSRLWLALAAACVLAVALSTAFATPLDDYVNTPDPHYNWTLVKTVKKPEYTAYMIRLTSQKWMTEVETDQPVWQHWLTVTVPNKIETSTVFMYMDGGHTNDGAPGDANALPQIIAVEAKSVVAELDQIPNEPIVFFNDGVRRSEDAMIAYTWLHFLQNPNDPVWLARLPMTKAAVRAMDAIQEFVPTLGLPQVPNFVVAGASKRGWTTWTTGAVDKRVTAIVPIVMDALNLVPVLKHMYQFYGHWSFALDDYTKMNVTDYINDPSFEAMAAIIDPLVYKERYAKKQLYVIDATGDEFFCPDDSTYWYNIMKATMQTGGELHLRMVPDAEHSLTGHQIDVALAVTAFYRSLILGAPRPQYSWTRDPETGRIVVSTVTKPTSVKMWHAHNANARDFRLVTCWDIKNCLNPIIWTYTTLQPQADGTYVAEMPMPKKGWTGFFVQLDYDANNLGMTGNDHFFKFTTETSIIPNVLPYPPPP